MGMILAWLMTLVPTAVGIAGAFVAWRRVRRENVGGMPLVTTTMFVSAAAAGAFLTLALLAITGPWALGQPTPIAVALDPVQQEVFREGSGFVGGYSALEVFSGLDDGTVVLASLGLAAGYLPPAAIAALIAVGAHAVLTGRVFRRSITVGAVATAGICVVFGTLQQGLANAAGSQASLQLRDAVAGMTDGGFLMLVRVPQYNPWPVAAAVGFLALAVIVRRGARIAEQSRGLV
ncbi:hypothetical protein GCM10022200_07520 [Microbacterium awajiense]|uniref:Uncharacterized protein n=1 Tax=Microbacterium awajiense TaxID=415214 RepID=A0ABP7A9H8_9MICO